MDFNCIKWSFCINWNHHTAFLDVHNPEFSYCFTIYISGNKHSWSNFETLGNLKVPSEITIESERKIKTQTNWKWITKKENHNIEFFFSCRIRIQYYKCKILTSLLPDATRRNNSSGDRNYLRTFPKCWNSCGGGSWAGPQLLLWTGRFPWASEHLGVPAQAVAAGRVVSPDPPSWREKGATVGSWPALGF